MGVQIGDIVSKKNINLHSLNHKKIAIDGHNTLYQFLSIIRSYDGRPLMDRMGNVTSHLSGLLYRTANFIELGIKPVYVFDGKPPVLKQKEIERRQTAKKKATKKYQEALKKKRFKEAKMYAQATVQLKDYMINDAKRLLDLMGIPWIQAPSEGEAQTAYMTASDEIWTAVSQDYDSLLFGASRLVRNITITGKRKLPRRNVYVEVTPEVVELKQVLRELGITREQLIILGILIGTDFNPDGIKGVGPKTALAHIKKYGTLQRVVHHVGEAQFPVDPEQIFEIFINPEVTHEYSLTWRQPKLEGITEFLCGERDFSEKRVQTVLEKMIEAFTKQAANATLEKWF